MSASVSAKVKFDSFSKISRVSLRRPLDEDSDEISELSEGTTVQPGISGRSAALRWAVCIWSSLGLVLFKSNGASDSQIWISDGLRSVGLVW